jgi:hypothetical protein
MVGGESPPADGKLFNTDALRMDVSGDKWAHEVPDGRLSDTAEQTTTVSPVMQGVGTVLPTEAVVTIDETMTR